MVGIVASQFLSQQLPQIWAVSAVIVSELVRIAFDDHSADRAVFGGVGSGYLVVDWADVVPKGSRMETKALAQRAD